MITHTFNSNFGQFKTSLTASFPDGTPTIVMEGFEADALYRFCGSSADKKVGVGKKDDDGNLVGYKNRKDVPYNASNVRIITDAVTAAIAKVVKVEEGAKATKEQQEYINLNLQFAITGQHVFGETVTPMVRARTLVEASLGNEQLEPLMRMQFKVVGMGDKADTATKDELIEFAHSKGFGLDPRK